MICREPIINIIVLMSETLPFHHLEFNYISQFEKPEVIPGISRVRLFKMKVTRTHPMGKRLLGGP